VNDPLPINVKALQTFITMATKALDYKQMQEKEYDWIVRVICREFPVCRGWLEDGNSTPISLMATRDLVYQVRTCCKNLGTRREVRVDDLSMYGTHDTKTIEGTLSALLSIAAEVENLALKERVDTIEQRLSNAIEALGSAVDAMKKSTDFIERMSTFMEEEAGSDKEYEKVAGDTADMKEGRDSLP
jgi:hypothetical protein